MPKFDVFLWVSVKCFYTIFFFDNRVTTFNMDETDGIVVKRSVYLFILPTNKYN